MMDYFKLLLLDPYSLRRYIQVFCEVIVRDTVVDEPPSPVEAAAPAAAAGTTATSAVLALLEDHRRMLVECRGAEPLTW